LRRRFQGLPRALGRCGHVDPLEKVSPSRRSIGRWSPGVKENPPMMLCRSCWSHLTGPANPAAPGAVGRPGC
jgi:hypothetical protein